ncbi:MAG TPA: hypothetical protein VIF09_11130, partial [Polyangiaceae bacterium]
MRLRFAALVLPVLAALAFASCSNEGEGQPCSPQAGNSGNDDCQSGLICTVVTAGTRCCPQDRTTAKTSECALSSTAGGDASPAPPVDGSTSETSSAEGSTDGTAQESAAKEGGAEGGSEAASSEGGASDGA